MDKWKKKLIGYSDTPELDVRFLSQKAQNDAEMEQFILRRQKGEPVSKIIGEWSFWSLDLKVNQHTLTPRPDSETIIDAVLKFFPNKQGHYRILDLGCGSGCLLLALLSEYQNSTGIGLDFSKEALKVACENGKGFKAEFIEKDWFDENWTTDLGKFDIIISNPPYIPTKDIQNLDIEVKNYDPLTALDGGEDGLKDYRRLSETISPILNEDGMIFFEIGQGQADDVIQIMNRYTLVETFKDLGQITRVLTFKRK